jgi:phosphoribosylanthranilate isomerase
LPAPAARALPLILAGGLRADNVAAALVQVRPYAVDVSSGVEQARGIKSVDRMRSFLAAVRRADAENGAA